MIVTNKSAAKRPSLLLNAEIAKISCAGTDIVLARFVRLWRALTLETWRSILICVLARFARLWRALTLVTWRSILICVLARFVRL
jgi:hypothetical protein